MFRDDLIGKQGKDDQHNNYMSSDDDEEEEESYFEEIERNRLRE